MQIRIKQCKHCPLVSDCSYKRDLKRQVKGILKNTIMQHNCSHYKTIFKTGDRVKVTVCNQVFEDFRYRWERIGDFTGTIEGDSSSAIVRLSKYYLIQLDEDVEVSRNGGVQHRKWVSRTADKIKLIESELCIQSEPEYS